MPIPHQIKFESERASRQSKICRNVHLGLDRARSAGAQLLSNPAPRRSPAATSKEWHRAQQASTGRDETGVMDSTHHPQPAAPARPRRRRPRQPVKRPRTIRFALTDEEFTQVAAAAYDRRAYGQRRLRRSGNPRHRPKRHHAVRIPASSKSSASSSAPTQVSSAASA